MRTCTWHAHLHVELCCLALSGLSFGAWSQLVPLLLLDVHAAECLTQCQVSLNHHLGKACIDNSAPQHIACSVRRGAYMRSCNRLKESYIACLEFDADRRAGDDIVL